MALFIEDLCTKHKCYACQFIFKNQQFLKVKKFSFNENVFLHK